MSANHNSSSYAWWLATHDALDGDGDKLRVLRRLADALEERPLWKLIAVEVGQLRSALPRTVSGPRLAFAVLLDACHRHAPAALPPLAKVMAVSENGSSDFGLAGLLTKALDAVFRAWAGLFVETSATNPMTAERALSTLMAQREIVAWEPAVTLDSDEGRRRQGALILSMRAGMNLREAQLGTLCAGLWARDPVLQQRLLRVGGTVEPRPVLCDLVALAVLAALRLRRVLAETGRVGPVPDATLLDHSPEAVTRLLAQSARPSTPRPASPTPAAAPEPAAAGPGMPLTGLPADWWQAALAWSQGQAPKLERLLDRTRRIPETERLWPLIEAELKRLQPSKPSRRQEAARLAFASLVDELRRAFPLGPSRFFDLIAGDDAVDLTLVGRLWAQLEPLFVEWGRELAPTVEPENKGALLRALHTHGDILPWDEEVRGSPEARRRATSEVIARTYSKKPVTPEEARRGVYWAATWARNEDVHGTTQNLADAIGAGRAVDLLEDTLALAALASLRFKLAWARLHDTAPTLPDISKIEELIRPGSGRR